MEKIKDTEKKDKVIEKGNTTPTLTEEEIQALIAKNAELVAEKEAIEAEKEELVKDKKAIEEALANQKSELIITKEDKIADANEAKRTAELLKKNMIKIKIPVDEKNPSETHVPVTINGYTWTIKRGESVEVPEAVADILTDAKYI